MQKMKRLFGGIKNCMELYGERELLCPPKIDEESKRARGALGIKNHRKWKSECWE
jgi:hypothetical protein